jgi:transcriptional regulator of heat shock response
MSFDNLQNSIKDEADLSGFETLWQTGHIEAKNFIKSKFGKVSDKVQDELGLINKELEEKDFEVQKLGWQVSEREKELRNLYDELHKLIELNKKLMIQLGDFETLVEKQEQVLKILSKDPKTNKEPVLPRF